MTLIRYIYIYRTTHEANSLDYIHSAYYKRFNRHAEQLKYLSSRTRFDISMKPVEKAAYGRMNENKLKFSKKKDTPNERSGKKFSLKNLWHFQFLNRIHYKIGDNSCCCCYCCCILFLTLHNAQ